jgi:FkbM family methyltransferase
MENKTQIVRTTLNDGSIFEIKFSPGDVIIDCGANVGDVSEPFVRLGATVLAYEPNIHAYKKLVDRFEGRKNIRCFNTAVANKCGKAKLHLHTRSKEDPLKYSTGSSLKEDKENVDNNNFLEIDTIDLSEIIRKIKKVTGKNVHVLKIDIEGGECELVEHLLDLGLLADITYVFIETHEKKIPSLREPTRRMIERIKQKNLTNINFNWI